MIDIRSQKGDPIIVSNVNPILYIKLCLNAYQLLYYIYMYFLIYFCTNVYFVHFMCTYHVFVSVQE